MSTGGKPGPQTKPGQGGLAAPSSQAKRLDKLNRRSTPDSEALASSDEETDPHRQDPPLPAVQPQRPVRRASWLNDTSQAAAIRPRKESFASSSMSPTTSHPSTPSAESGVGAWGSHAPSAAVLNRGHAGSSATFPWATAIWNNERKEPPSRLAEVLPSPTTALPPSAGLNQFYTSDSLPTQTSPGPREQAPTAQIPFPIPLHPTPKTYRSQSYSVGQLEPDAAVPSTSAAMGSSGILSSRGRTIPHSGLQHRPSRPSMLSEMSNEGGMLGKVKEVEDDGDESTSDSLQNAMQQSAEAKTIELLTRENAMLRQQANHQYHNTRIRPRASTAAAYGLGNGYGGVHSSVPEESDYAIDELDEVNDGELAARRDMVRRMSEFAGAGGAFRSPYALENRKLENVKKAYWQSSLGFGGLGDISQSRRHSFADVPTRQASISSMGDSVLAHEQAAQEAQAAQEFGSPFADSHNFTTANPAQSYFPGGAGMAGSQQALAASAYNNAYQSYNVHAGFSGRPSSPPRTMYGISQPNRSTPLHVVLFKCSRADVFYIQEGTGLTVKPGDLVIVEADRGTDLGTVAASDVDWAEAKRLKEHYAEEQYKWLMMYSQHAGAGQEGVGPGLMAVANGLQGSAVGGMGPPGQHHMQEPNSGELKPKMIKRLAQTHEVTALREKEGNEAKAKRVCMQKVKEHGLNMEILDAEFQMDWKKLTFYYFADSYINFNSLVTDLFKIYKTRIWMSAINPASFASQPLGLQAPSGIGPGAVGVGRGPSNVERRQNQQQQEQPQQQQQQQQPSAFAPSGQGGRGFPGSMNPFSSGERPVAAAAAAAAAMAAGAFPPSYSYGPYGAAFGGGAMPRPPALAYTPGMIQAAEAYPAGYPQGRDYTGLPVRFPPASAGSGQHDQALPPLGAAPVDWAAAFQNLSLNGRQ